MSMYYCEGTVRQVKVVNGVAKFTIEPSVPYIYEKEQTEDGVKRVVRLMLVVDSLDTPKRARFFGLVDFRIPVRLISVRCSSPKPDRKSVV